MPNDESDDKGVEKINLLFWREKEEEPETVESIIKPELANDILDQLKMLDKLFDVKSLKKIEATLKRDSKGKLGFDVGFGGISIGTGISQSTETGMKFTLEGNKS